jgi:hypothetical protein
LLVSVLALAGCNREAGAPAGGAATATAPALANSLAAIAPSSAPSAAASASASASAGGARTVSEENDLYAFDYEYPAQAGAIAGLRDWLDSEIDRQRKELVAQARQGRAEAKQGGFNYSAYYKATGWQVVADLPGWLSLSAGIESYQGGAHPNHWFGALLWDKAANQRRAATDLFVSKQALAEAIRMPFCAAIDRERAERRGEKINRNSGDMFDECIDPAAQTVILGSSNRRTFDRIGVLVAPYAAGPYAEGEYEATLPVTPAVLAAVKPEFRDSFAVKR